MIRYPITLAELERRVDQLAPTWRKKAQSRLAKFKAAKKYNEKAGIWSDIKRVYMDLQYRKCAYCEKQLEGGVYGPIEHDVEHFRPKSSIAAWPNGDRAAKLGYRFKTGGGSERGYYLLSYHLLNYCTSCKSCNSPLKSNFFPIASKRGKTDANQPADLRGEECFLIYPIGDADADPESLIGFDGLLAVPKVKSGAKARRARVTIDFFDLNGDRSLDLMRAQQIRIVAPQLKNFDSPRSAAEKALAKQVIDLMLKPQVPHANCVRSFVRLWRDDRVRAEHIEAACVRLLGR
jgi:hypothetical protein